MWIVWDCIDEETKEKLRKAARKPKNWNPAKERQAITIEGKIEGLDELERIMKQCPKGKGI